MAIYYQHQNSNQFHNSWKHCPPCFSSAKVTPLHEKIKEDLFFNGQATLNGGEMEKTGMYQNTKRYVGVHLRFRDVYFLRGCLRREKVHPAARVTHVTVLPVFVILIFINPYFFFDIIVDWIPFFTSVFTSVFNISQFFNLQNF